MCRGISAWLMCALAAVLTGCTHDGPSRELTNSASPTATTTRPSGAEPSSIGGASASHASATTKASTPTSHATPSAHRPRVLAPAGTNPSGVICNHVSRSDVAKVLPGTPAGQEIDLENTAVSYCDFGTASLGTVDVGVKNMGTAAEATAAVRNPYGRMSQQPDQSTHTFTVNGEFAFENSTATRLKSGATLYAVNAQGSRGKWYVTIQYYSHKSCSASAMQRLLEAVLDRL